MVQVIKEKTMEMLKFTLNQRSNNYGEFPVKCYVNGKYNEDKTYYANDYRDAMGTLQVTVTDYMTKGYKCIDVTNIKRCYSVTLAIIS